MSDTAKYHAHDYPPKTTGPEGLAWAAAAVGVAVVGIALLVVMNAEYDADAEGALAWVGVGQWIAGVALVPAILLTGIRHLMPAARAFFPSAGRVAGGEQVADAENG